MNREEMSKRVYFGMRILMRIPLYVLILIFATALVSVSTAEAFDLYNFVDERVDIYNEDVGVLQEDPFSNALIKIFGDQRIAVHAEDQTIGLIISEGMVERVTRDELPKTTVDVYTDAKTLRER